MKIAHKFYLREAKDTQNETAIYLQLTYNRTNTKRAIGFDVKANDWDANMQRAKKNHAINTRINKLEQAITDLQYNLGKGAKVYSLAHIADFIFEKKSVQIKLAEYFEEYIEKAAQSKRTALPTQKHYKSCLNALRDFMQIKIRPYTQPILGL